MFNRAKEPGSRYCFNLSLVGMILATMNALASASFPGYFAIAVLFFFAFFGWFRPMTTGPGMCISSKFGFVVYSVFMLVVANTQDHLLHKNVTIAGMLCIPAFAIVGFYLGRYIALNRLSVQPDDE